MGMNWYVSCTPVIGAELGTGVISHYGLTGEGLMLVPDARVTDGIRTLNGRTRVDR